MLLINISHQRIYQHLWVTIFILKTFIFNTKRIGNIYSVNSPPSAAYMRQWTRSALVRVMACRLFGAKPLPEPMLAYCQLDLWEQISVKFELEFYHFLFRKCIWNCRLPKWRPFCPGGDELMKCCSKHVVTAAHTRFFEWYIRYTYRQVQFIDALHQN